MGFIALSTACDAMHGIAKAEPASTLPSGAVAVKSMKEEFLHLAAPHAAPCPRMPELSTAKTSASSIAAPEASPLVAKAGTKVVEEQPAFALEDCADSEVVELRRQLAVALERAERAESRLEKLLRSIVMADELPAASVAANSKIPVVARGCFLGMPECEEACWERPGL